MMFRRIAFITSILATAVSCFTLGVIQARHADWTSASYDARFDALRLELKDALARTNAAPIGTTGDAVQASRPVIDTGESARAEMVFQIKEQLQNEMGLLPVSLLRERSSSFVELYSYDSAGQRTYGTAGYLGRGYFVTVKHAVVTLPDNGAVGARTITRLTVVYKGKEIPATVIDKGTAEVEVDSGDWAIIKTQELDLPPLRVDTAFPYEFADPIFRLGNDYSKGIVVSTGYVGQRTEGGLVTCLTDGHPGVSGGGVLDRRGALVGIPIGRMQGDYRFSFILPMRAEMMRKVPVFIPADAISVVATITDLPQ
jgi:S1-C subfamily serine protease